MYPNYHKSLSQSSLDARARRSALRVGLLARKSRKRRDSLENQGGFMLIDSCNCLEAGPQFDMSAEDVVEYCSKYSSSTCDLA